MTVQIAHTLREYRHDTDAPFVVKTWYKNAAEAHGGWAPTAALDRLLKGAITRLLARAKCTIAHSTEGEDHMLGFIVTEPHEVHGVLLHFAFVKSAFRRLGLARTMIYNECQNASAPPTLTTWGSSCSKLDWGKMQAEGLIQSYRPDLFDGRPEHTRRNYVRCQTHSVHRPAPTLPQRDLTERERGWENLP